MCEVSEDTATEAQVRAFEVAADLAAAASAVLAAIEDLAGPVRELAELEAKYLAALNAAGYRDRRPPVRELAAEVAHAALEPLRPYVPFVTAESGRRAADALAGPPPIVEAVNVVVRYVDE